MKNQIIRTLIFQYLLGVTYLIGTGLWDAASMFSALIGCLAALLPTTWFGYRMIKAQDQENDAALILGYAYRSEIGKWVMMALIFWMAFTTEYPWDPGFLFAGFVLVLMSGWVAPLVIKE